MKRNIITCLFFAILVLNVQSQTVIQWKNCLKQNSKWYSSKVAYKVAENVLSFQNSDGGWPKNIDMARYSKLEYTSQLDGGQDTLLASTIDNSATYTQMRFLFKVYKHKKENKIKVAFNNGLNYLLLSQYSNGGWPQFYPLRKGYYSHITFNDDAMTGVLDLLYDIGNDKEYAELLGKEIEKKVKISVEKGINCILKCQIKIDNKLTVWCAQHDEKDYSPAKARAYELPSLSGAESCGIVNFLMKIKKPSPEIINSIKCAVAWLDSHRVKGLKEVYLKDTSALNGKDREYVKDEKAPDLWARFYDLETQKPFFCSRDGIKHSDISEISYERRNHYGWYGTWPQELIEKDYPKWLKKISKTKEKK